MDNLNKIKLLFLFFFSFLLRSIQCDADDDEMNIIDAAKRLYSLPTTPHSFAPPHLDFRCSGGGGDDEERSVVKVKDALVKSLDKGRATMEDSAKSAADFVNKLKPEL